MTAPLVIGFCASCRAPKYRDRWNGPVRCEHRAGCLEAKRQARTKQERIGDARPAR